MTAADYNWPPSAVERDLRATIARVEALAESWQRESEYPNGHSLLVQAYRGHAADLRAALEPR